MAVSANKTTTSSGLPAGKGRGKVRSSAGDVAAGTLPADPQQLADLIKNDRIARRLTWPRYAEFLGVKLSTIYKIAKGRVQRPHELTLAVISDRLFPKTEGGADREVVPDGSNSAR